MLLTKCYQGLKICYNRHRTHSSMSMFPYAYSIWGRGRDNHLGRWRNITSHRPAALRSAPRCGKDTAHPHGHTHYTRTHCMSHQGTRTNSITALCHCYEDAARVRRRAACASNADALAAVRAVGSGPGRATADGRRSPPHPGPRAQPVRAPRRPSSPRTPPLIHYLRTADRFQARSFCPPRRSTTIVQI